MTIVAPISATGVDAAGDRRSRHRRRAVGDRCPPGSAVTVAGVVLASRESDHPGTERPPARARPSCWRCSPRSGSARSSSRYDVAADGSVLWALLVARSVAVPFVGGLVLAARRAVLPRGRDLVALCAAGMLDLAATGLYALANRHGDLSVVSVSARCTR